MKRTALAITGPTASGKTALSLSVAETLDCEIVCCDSMQIYKEMDIGTAKPTPAERERVPHHILDFLNPCEPFSAEDYRARALPVCDGILSRGKTPMFVGGTGLYIDTVIRGSSPISPPSDSELTNRLISLADSEEGRARLWQRLKEVDPVSAEKTHMNNVRRVARAIEIYELTGVPKSELDRRSREVPADIAVGMITLDFHNRENLYSRVDARVDEMMRQGLPEEVRSLYERGLLDPSYTSAQAIGYKEMLGWIRGEMSFSDAIESLKLATRRYAKRQLTWFRNKADAYTLYVDREGGAMRPASELEDEAVAAASELIEKLKLGSAAESKTAADGNKH